MPYIIGLNSGSSFDGVDVVLCEISIGADGQPTKPQYIEALTVSWPPELQTPIMKAFSNELSIFEMARVNYAAGALFAEAVHLLLEKAGLLASDIAVVGYDGQTIFQEPPDRAAMSAFNNNGSSGSNLVGRWMGGGGFAYGFFIAESGVVAALTNITTVTQFRPVDHALGGSGAPLMQYLDYVSFRHQDRPVATLNIGGIANVQLVNGPNRDRMMAFDTGPGNVIIDHVVKAREGIEYDQDGQLARKGSLIMSLHEKLMGHQFFERKPPRSAWRLDFGADFADGILRDYERESTQDILHTVTYFTATAVEEAIVKFVLPKASIKQLIASGGGTRNAFLLETLRSKLKPHGIEVIIADEVGLPATYKEAIKFATLAFACLNGIANNIPAASGAGSYAVLGKMTLAPSLAKAVG